MLSVNGKNCQVIQKIGIGLRMVEKYSVNRTRLIKYNWVQLRVKVHELMNNEDKYLGMTFQVKYRGQLIVRLKTIKSKKDTFCYLSFYLYYSFF